MLLPCGWRLISRLQDARYGKNRQCQMIIQVNRLPHMIALTAHGPVADLFGHDLTGCIVVEARSRTVPIRRREGLADRSWIGRQAFAMRAADGYA